MLNFKIHCFKWAREYLQVHGVHDANTALFKKNENKQKYAPYASNPAHAAKQICTETELYCSYGFRPSYSRLPSLNTSCYHFIL